MAHKAKWYRKIYFLICISLLALTLSFAGCSQQSYTYNNLLESSLQSSFPELEKFLVSYSTCPYAEQKLKAGWQTGYIGKENYKYSTALTMNGEMDVDINCRMTAFLLIKGLVQSNNALQNAFYTVDTLPQEWSEREKNLYQVLFGQEEGESGISTRWADFGLSMPENVYLLTAWENGKNLHAGVVFLQEEEILFIEKIDPVLPFQLSKFDSFRNLKEYLCKGRFKGMSEVDLYLNDKDFNDNLENEPKFVEPIRWKIDSGE